MKLIHLQEIVADDSFDAAAEALAFISANPDPTPDEMLRFLRQGAERIMKLDAGQQKAAITAFAQTLFDGLDDDGDNFHSTMSLLWMAGRAMLAGRSLDDELAKHAAFRDQMRARSSQAAVAQPKKDRPERGKPRNRNSR